MAGKHQLPEIILQINLTFLSLKMDFSFVMGSQSMSHWRKEEESVKITRAHKHFLGVAWFLPGGGPWARSLDEGVEVEGASESSQVRSRVKVGTRVKDTYRGDTIKGLSSE